MTSPPSTISLGIIQCALGATKEENLQNIEALIREAAEKGANVVLPPELFEGPYFPQTENEESFDLAAELSSHSTVERFSKLASELGVAIPVSVFEKSGQSYYNSVVMLDTDGSQLGVYRKAHIPDGPGYEEKYYFRPGDTGFKVFATKVGRIGVGICWDQWFPECARVMALAGAEVLLYPTAIGSEPEEPELDTREPWRRVMVGHAVANAIPVAASNRIGTEQGIDFYGTSFISDARGDIVVDLQGEAGVGVCSFDRKALQRYRDGFGFFRDRRPDLYSALQTADGKLPL